jgi:protein SCO1/2
MIARFLRLLTEPEKAVPPRERRRCDGFANSTVTDQFGERMRFRDRFVDGRALIVNTMFTVCQGTCPGTSSTLSSLREALSPIFGDGLTIVSISLTPDEDSPAALRAYARIYGADRRRPGLCGWHFLTGRPDEIDRLRRSLGFYDLDPRIDADITQHAELLLFGNSRSDRWSVLPASLRQPLLIESIRRVAGFTSEQKYGLRG